MSEHELQALARQLLRVHSSSKRLDSSILGVLGQFTTPVNLPSSHVVSAVRVLSLLYFYFDALDVNFSEWLR